MALPIRLNSDDIFASWWNDIRDELLSNYSNKYTEDLVFTGSQNSKIVDVTGKVADPTTTIMSLLDASNGYAQISCTIRSVGVNSISVFTHANLPAGTYRLVVIG